MKRISLIVLFFVGLLSNAKAQHDPTDQIFSASWEIIGDVDFKTVKETEMYAIFNNEIKKYNGKPFELEGYIVPIKDGMKQTKFMLSTLPINQCFYCGKNGVPIMVLVELVEPIKFTYETVKIRGTLKLSTANAMDIPPVSLINGKAI
ncbi:MAG: hypothetical protein EOO99_03370 [Pedobacter sp.]|nr:MAG: hypothetical protein EOO99_03370 [Pedobacter sp.]